MAKRKTRKHEYALYRGDDFITIGTKDELAKLIGVKPQTISFYASSTYKEKFYANGYIAVNLDLLQKESEK